MVNERLLAAFMGGVCLVLQATTPMGGEVLQLTVDAARSRVVIDVGKAGVFGFAGHAHEVEAPSVTGTVSLDPVNWQRASVSLEFDASALRVTGKGEPPEDVPEVQRVMLSDRVLDSERHQVVTFRSNAITVLARKGNTADVQIHGELTLRGVTRPLSVRAVSALEHDGALTTRGRFPLKQTDFGIDPVTAAGGTVRVKDTLDVHFELVAHK